MIEGNSETFCWTPGTISPEISGISENGKWHPVMIMSI